MLKIGRKWRPFNQFTFSKNHFIHSFSLLSVMVHCRKKMKENLSEHVWIQVGTRNGSTLHNVNYPLKTSPYLNMWVQFLLRSLYSRYLSHWNNSIRRWKINVHIFCYCHSISLIRVFREGSLIGFAFHSHFI